MRRSLRAELGRLGWDCVATQEAGDRRMSGVRQLEWATAEGRCVLTANKDDFARIHAEWAAFVRVHAGIIIVTNQGAEIGRIIAALDSTSAAFPSGDLTSQILFLSNWMGSQSRQG